MTADDARATLVRELRDGANAWVGSGMSVGATVKLLVRAAGALDAEHARAEAAESNRDEFRNAWNAQGFEIIRLEDERDRLRRAIEDALAFIDDPGNWGAMDGRGKLLSRFLTEALEGAEHAD